MEVVENTLTLNLNNFMTWNEEIRSKGLVLAHTLATYEKMYLVYMKVVKGITSRNTDEKDDRFYFVSETEDVYESSSEMKSITEFLDRYETKSKWKACLMYKTYHLDITGASDCTDIKVNICRIAKSATVEESLNINKIIYEMISSIEERSNTIEFKSSIIL